MLLLAALFLAAPAEAKRYSYETCINSTKLWCRHQRINGVLIDQPTCVGENARQCADCMTYRYLRRIRGEADELGDCREWLDGTIVLRLRDARRAILRGMRANAWTAAAGEGP